jgi:cytochrome P450
VTVEPIPRFTQDELAALDDPYPTYARLRAAGPLCRGGPAQWFVTRHAEVSALLKDPRLGIELPDAYRELSLGDGPARSFIERIIGRRDPPGHTRIRRLMGVAFSPSHLRQLQAGVERMVDRMLARCRELGEFDIVTELAFPLPVQVVCEAIGLPAPDHELIRPKASALAGAFTGFVSTEDRREVGEALTWLREYIHGMLDGRGDGDDLLSRMVRAAADPDNRTSHDEIVDNLIFLFFAGFETTMNLIASGAAALSRDPAAFGALAADPTLVPLAVEEFLRRDAPFQTTVRFTREPIVVDGRRISAGRVIVLMLGSANYDERVFTDPDRLDVTRTPNPHVSFGGGSHYCLGAVLARMEAKAVFTGIVRDFARLEPAGEVVRADRFRSYRAVPLLGRGR